MTAAGSPEDSGRISVRKERSGRHPWVARKKQSYGDTTTSFDSWPMAMAYVGRYWLRRKW